MTHENSEIKIFDPDIADEENAFMRDLHKVVKKQRKAGRSLNPKIPKRLEGDTAPEAAPITPISQTGRTGR